MNDSLEKIYADIPALNCKRRCQEFCGPVTGGPLEQKRLAAAPRAAMPSTEPDSCTFLDGITGGCTIYDIRPLICRLWGLVEDLRCPHGCVPERLLTKAEAYALLRRTAKIQNEAP